MASDSVSQTNMLFKGFVPIHVPSRDQGLLESYSSVLLFSLNFANLKTASKSDLSFDIYFELWFILGICTRNFHNLMGRAPDSNSYCIEINFLSSQ
jgi:hypothetical protein